MNLRCWFFAALVAALALGACGDDGTMIIHYPDGGPDDVVAPDDTPSPEDDGGVDTTPACPGIPEDEVLLHDEAMRIVVVGAPTVTAASAAICRYTPAYDWAVKLGESGPCRVLDWLPPIVEPAGENLDTGDITVSINGTEYPLADADTSLACFRGPGRVLPALAAGDTVRAWSTGGTEVPAFDLTVTVPEMPTVTEPAAGATLTTCQPWNVAWTPTTIPNISASFVTTLPDDRTFSISCRQVAATPLVIPPALTGFWTADSSTARLNFGVGVEAVSTGTPSVTLEVQRQAEGVATVTIARP